MDERSFLSWALQGDVRAVEMCELLGSMSQVIDDLVDKDKPVTNHQVVRAFWSALIALPANTFYRANEQSLRPMLAVALQDWTDATKLESIDNPHAKHLAFVLRDQLTSIVIQSAGIIGGYDWMQEVSMRARLKFHNELFEDYVAKLGEVQNEHG
ncbi:MAG: hypothetical protein ACPGMR_03190 [Pontibacterium sp.]